MNKKIKIFTIEVYCSGCGTLLYKYKKEGSGSLVKCYTDRIIEDHAKGNLKCPNCQQDFARQAIIHNRPANKIIQGRVFTRGHCKK